MLVGVSVVAFLGLAYWQFQRFESVTGDGQNLGYALQWPLFAAFVIWAYRRFVQYEDEGPPPPPTDRVTEIPEGLLPELAGRRETGPSRSHAHRIQRISGRPRRRR